MQKFLSLIFICFSCLSGAWASNLDPSQKECMCFDDTTVAQGEYCPDGTFCPYNCVGCRDSVTTNGAYQTVVTATCDTSTGNCVRQTTYQCAPGYFGKTIDGQSGCTSCASATGNTKATSDAGARFKINCYLPVGTTGDDESGHFYVTDNCYWTN